MRVSINQRTLPATLYGVIWRQSALLQGVVIALGLALPPLSVLPLDIQRRIIDDAIPALDGDLLLMLSVAFAGAVFLAALLKFAIYYLRGLIEARVTRYLRLLVLDAQRRRRGGAARAAVGPVSSIVAEEAFPLGGFAAEAVNTPLIEGAQLVGVAGFMLYVEPWLASVGIGVMALQGIVVPVVQQHVNRMARRRVNAIRRANADMIAATEGRPGVHFHDSLRETRLDYRLRLRMNVLKAGMKAFLKLTDNLAVIVVLGVGGAMVIAGETTVGVIVAFLAGFKRVHEPWDALINFYRTFADAHIKYRLILSAMGGAIAVEPDAAPGPAIAVHLP